MREGARYEIGGTPRFRRERFYWTVEMDRAGDVTIFVKDGIARPAVAVRIPAAEWQSLVAAMRKAQEDDGENA